MPTAPSVRAAFEEPAKPSEKKTKSAMLEEAKSRIANAVDMDSMFQPPKLKRKYGVGAVEGSDESSDEGERC